MKKTKEIQSALRRRGFVKSEIIDLKNKVETLSKRLYEFECELKGLDFELSNWDKFNNKTNF